MCAEGKRVLGENLVNIEHSGGLIALLPGECGPVPETGKNFRLPTRPASRPVGYPRLCDRFGFNDRVSGCDPIGPCRLAR